MLCGCVSDACQKKVEHNEPLKPKKPAFFFFQLYTCLLFLNTRPQHVTSVMTPSHARSCHPSSPSPTPQQQQPQQAFPRLLPSDAACMHLSLDAAAAQTSMIALCSIMGTRQLLFQEVRLNGRRISLRNRFLLLATNVGEHF